MEEEYRKACLRRHYENMESRTVLRLKKELTKKRYLILVKRVNYAKGYKFV